MILANYAEAPPGSGLLNMIGGAWDTINVHAPLDGAPENVFAVMQGHLVIRLLFHATETDRDHNLQVTVMDEDGQQLASAEAEIPIKRDRGLPAGWLQGANL